MPRVPRVPPQLSELPFRGSQAVGDGLLTKSMLRGPTWRRLLPDIYLHTDGYRETDQRMWCRAVALTLPPGGAIAGLSAAYLWGADLIARAERSRVSVALPATARMRAHPHVNITRSALPPTDVAQADGLPVTTAVRTAFDLGRRAPRTAAVIMLDALLNRGVVKQSELGDYLETHNGWPGVARLREVLALAEPLSESATETRLRLLLIDAGAPPPIAQYEVPDGEGRPLTRVDLAYPRWKIALECRSDPLRPEPGGSPRRDVARLSALRAAGWRVLSFNQEDVARHPGRTAHLVAGAIRQRCR